jgi:hypothetical protein
MSASDLITRAAQNLIVCFQCDEEGSMGPGGICDAVNRLHDAISESPEEFQPPLGGEFETALEDLLDCYVEFADEIFPDSTIAIAKYELQRQLEAASNLLGDATVESASKARMLIDNALKSHEAKLAEIDQPQELDTDSLDIYWKVWQVLDRLIQRIPQNDYQYHAARLYSTISMGLRHPRGIAALLDLMKDCATY